MGLMWPVAATALGFPATAAPIARTSAVTVMIAFRRRPMSDARSTSGEPGVRRRITLVSQKPVSAIATTPHTTTPYGTRRRSGSVNVPRAPLS